MSKLPMIKPRVQTLALSKVRMLPRPSRGSHSGQGLYTYRWKQARLAFLRAHPLCQCPDCDEGRKRVMPASVVDHRIPHRGDERLFWSESNWTAMAKQCHDAKTAREDSGFGNPAKT